MVSFTWVKQRLCYRTQIQRTGASTLVRGHQKRSKHFHTDTHAGIWAAMRNSGSVVGGAISFSTNYKRATAGGVSWSTYLIFLGFRMQRTRPAWGDLLTGVAECTGFIWAFLLSPTRSVRRRNGSSIPMSEPMPWKREFAALLKTLQLRKVRLYER